VAAPWNNWERAKCYSPAICLCSPATTPRGAAARYVRTELEEWIFTQDYADRTLRDHFKLLTLDGVGLANGGRRRRRRAILHYLRDTQRAALDHLDRPTYFDRADSMILDAVTVRNLELIEPLFAADASGPHNRLPCLPRSIRVSPAWAGVYCASACCVRRWIVGRSSSGSTR